MQALAFIISLCSLVFVVLAWKRGRESERCLSSLIESNQNLRDKLRLTCDQLPEAVKLTHQNTAITLSRLAALEDELASNEKLTYEIRQRHAYTTGILRALAKDFTYKGAQHDTQSKVARK